MMLCNNCNKEIEDQALFCNYCGVSQKANKNAQQRVCPKCRIEFDDDVIFCNLCGAKLIADCPSEHVGTSNNEYGDELPFIFHQSIIPINHSTRNSTTIHTQTPRANKTVARRLYSEWF